MKYKALDAVEEQNAVEMEEAKAMDAVEVNNVEGEEPETTFSSTIR